MSQIGGSDNRFDGQWESEGDGMFHVIVVALDGSTSSLHALEQAIDLAGALHARLEVVSVVEGLPPYVSKQTEIQEQRSEAARYFGRLHADVRRDAARRGLSITTRVVFGHEVQSIVDDARAVRADLLVIGARGHSGVWGAFLGSTADKLIAHAPTSLLVVHPNDIGNRYAEILVGLDGSPLGDRALSVAIELAQADHGIVRALIVVEGEGRPVGGATGAMDSQFLESIRSKARATAETAGQRLEIETRQGHAARELTLFAQEIDADLIVIGATGQERPWSPTTGGTARRVANEAGRAVLLVRSPRPASMVREVMTRVVTTVTPDTPLRGVVEQLVQRGVKALPVVDGEDRVVGIITGGDLLRRGAIDLRLSLHDTYDASARAELLERLESSGQTARSVMTAKPRTVRDDATIEEVVRCLARHDIKRVPVVDANDRLVGIVSRTDLLRAFAAEPVATAEEHTRDTRTNCVGDLASTDVPTVQASAPADDVLAAILRSPFHRAVVTDPEGRVQGIVTDRALLARSEPAGRSDLVGRLAGRFSGTPAVHLPTRADALMEREVFTILADADVAEAVRQFLAHRVKRLVVVDAQHRLVGILDRRALLKHILGGAPGKTNRNQNRNQGEE